MTPLRRQGTLLSVLLRIIHYRAPVPTPPCFSEWLAPSSATLVTFRLDRKVHPILYGYSAFAEYDKDFRSSQKMIKIFHQVHHRLLLRVTKIFRNALIVCLSQSHRQCLAAFLIRCFV